MNLPTSVQELRQRLGGSAAEQRHLKLQPMGDGDRLGYYFANEYAELEEAMSAANFKIVAWGPQGRDGRSVLYEAADDSRDRVLMLHHETGPELVFVWLAEHGAAIAAVGGVMSGLSAATTAIKNVFDIMEKAKARREDGKRTDDVTNVEVRDGATPTRELLTTRRLSENALTEAEADDYIKRLVGVS